MSVQRFRLYAVDIINNILITLRKLWPWHQTVREPPYKHFTQIGDPVLRRRADYVHAESINSKEIEEIIDRMVHVLRNYDCVGVAAPQIGVPLRIIAMEFREEKKHKFTPEVYAARKMSTLPLTVLINPELKVNSEILNKHPEGCMSIRGFAAEVERYDSVTLTGVGKCGTPDMLELDGWNARIAQHEMDHLNGTIYIDRMDRSTFYCIDWQNVNSKGGKAAINFDK